MRYSREFDPIFLDSDTLFELPRIIAMVRDSLFKSDNEHD